MAGEVKNVKTNFIPPPIDGLNLLAPASQLGPTEARQLDNYWVTDSGIRERPEIVSKNLPDSSFPTAIIPFTSATIQGFLISSGVSGGNIYTYTPSTDTFSSSLDTDTFFTGWHFNKHVFMPLIVANEVARYSLATDTYAATSFTNPGSFTFNIGWAFKDRCYFVNDGTGEFRYGAVGAITGALSTAYDVGQFFQSGRYITWGRSWSYNQGDANEDLMVIGNDAGEVFVFSGDFPAASNWRLLTRLEIPVPLKKNFGPAAPALVVPVEPVNIGQDIFINTTRGVVSLAAVMAGRQDDERYFSLSRKIGPVLQGGSQGRSYVNPYLYCPAADSVYVMNYERGAWSRFPAVVGSSISQAAATIRDVTPPSSPSTSSYVVFGRNHSVLGTGGGLNVLNEASLVSATQTSYIWKTPFFNFGTLKTKTSRLIRVIGRAYNGLTFMNKVGVNSDFVDSSATTTEQSTEQSGTQVYQELSPPGVGRWLSYVFNKFHSSPFDETNEINGVDVFYEEGGAY